MSKIADIVVQAIQHGMKIRPQVGGFPYLAESLRVAGVEKNIWTLPACQSVYELASGEVVMQGTPLVSGTVEIPAFNREALIHALRTDQAGKSTFPEFLKAAWDAGCIGYEVDFAKRNVRYYGAKGESYLEEYPAVKI